MSTFRLIPISDLVRRPDVRPVDSDAIEALTESIGALGLMNPLTVRQLPDGMFEIIAGSHRYAACDSLGHHEIPCQVVELDDLHAEMAMIDENLRRSEVVGIQRDQQTARRKAIYEELHPETRNGENQHTRVRQVGEGSSTADRFTIETAALTGRSERSIQRSAERGAKVSTEAAQLMQGTKLDTGAYADRIKDLPPEEQAQTVRRDLATRSEPRQRTAPPSPTPSVSTGAYLRFVELADQIEALRISDIITAAGREKSKLGQRASSLADFMNDIVEGLAQ